MTRPPRVRGRALVAAAVGTALVLAGCSDDDTDAAPGVVAEPSSQPEAPPQRQPVVGEVEVQHEPVASSAKLGLGEPATPDDAAFAALHTAVSTALDAHLEALSTGGAGTLQDLAAPGLLDDPSVGALLTSLASPEDPAASARYVIRARHDGQPEWLTADVRVTTAGGQERHVVLIVTNEAGNPVLVGIGEGEAAS